MSHFFQELLSKILGKSVYLQIRNQHLYRMKKFFFSLSLLIYVSCLSAQDTQTLFTLDGEAITTAEFEKIYTKNNINNQADYSEASLNEYLDLFINFKLKVAEAEALQMDTIRSIKSELSTYQKQLVKNYANDKEVSEALLQEAYDRSTLEVDASHILVRWPSSYPSAKDSALVLKQIMNIRKGLRASSFAKQAKLKSQDPSAVENSGRLGYLTAFQTVYPFENALYKTKAGEISAPVATQFGYHLVLVHDIRAARGKIKTAHILIKSKEGDSPEKRALAKATVNQIYQDLVEGVVDFTTAVKQYSQDSKTKFQEGQLPELSTAEMITEFADAAFAIEKNGDFAEPVQTALGWHIIQRVSKTEIGTFDEAKSGLSSKISRDSRSNVAQTKNDQDSKVNFGYTTDKNYVNELIFDLAKSYDSGTFTLNEEDYTATIFSIGEDAFTQKDFVVYLKKTVKKAVPNPSVLPALLKGAYDKYESMKIQQYREKHLAEINEDYKDLMQEYHDGILLFELTDREVWSKAVMDTAGLKKFYDENKSNYMWSDRIAYTSYIFYNEKAALKGLKFINKGMSSATILAKLNKKETQVTTKSSKVLVEEFNYGSADIVVGSVFSNKLEDEKNEKIVVDALLGPETKKLNETRGYVISDYQSYLEKNWIINLKQKYRIQVNQEVFKSMIK